MEIGKEVVLRAQLKDETTARELRLAHAQVTGPFMSLRTDRLHLLRALKLGFTEIEITNPHVPLCCRDRNRIYVWMPLDSTAPTSHPKCQTTTTNDLTKEVPTMPDPNGNGKPVHSGEINHSLTDPLAEADAVRGLLAEAQSRLARLMASLKQHRRQARAVRAAMRSLKDLPPLTP
jgi:hypothetical protein